MPIALLTDFGTRDYFIGAVRGVILSISPSAVLADITHEIESHNIREAAFTLATCYRDFPAGTVFMCVVDPGVGSERRGIIVANDRYRFVSPDNGLLDLVISREDFEVFEIINPAYFAKNPHPSFHGRDIFAPVAAHLNNRVPPDEFGRRIHDFSAENKIQIHTELHDGLEAEIIHIDRFGNIVTNIQPDQISGPISITIAGTTITEHRHYLSEKHDENPFIIKGSAGFIEISIFAKPAARQLGVKVGDKLSVSLR